jgi:hypothetical protein
MGFRSIMEVLKTIRVGADIGLRYLFGPYISWVHTNGAR